MKLNLNSKQILEFFIKVDGTDIHNAKPRLILNTGNISYCFFGKIQSPTLTENDSNFSKFMNSSDEKAVVFEIPPLKEAIKSNTIDANIEVILEDKYYINAWSDTIEIEKPVSVKITESKTSNSPRVQIKSPKNIQSKSSLFETGSVISIKNKSGKHKVVKINEIIEENKQHAVLEVTDKKNKTKIIKLKLGK